MSDDIEKQLKERLAREQARHDKQRTSSMDGNAMDIDEIQSSQNDNNNNNSGRNVDMNTDMMASSSMRYEENKSGGNVQALQHSLRNRQQTIDEMSKQLQDLQRRYEEERLQYEREKAELTRLTGGSANTGATIHDVTMSESSSQAPSGGVGANTHSHDHNRQIMTDEELAQHLAVQFEREAQEEEEEERQRQQQQQQQRSGHPNEPTVRSFSYGDPNSGFTFQFSSSSSSSGHGHPMSEHPFGPSGMMGFGLESFFNDPFVRGSRRDMRDPFSAMRILPRSHFPGMMFGGALIDDNTDYDTLLHLFPPAPRGADHTVIEQLPEDVYKTKPKEKEKEKEKHASERKDQEVKEEDDEFHKCCICLESFKEGDAIRRLPCLHIFHRQEIDNWLLRNHLCPICRTPVEQNEPPAHQHQ